MIGGHGLTAMSERLHILLLENSSEDTALIRAALDAEGIASGFLCVNTQADFIVALQRGGFDLILADHSAAHLDGLSALQLTLEKTPEVPFIFVSATLGEELAIEAVKNGAADYVLMGRLERLGPCVRRALREAAERARHKAAERAQHALAENALLARYRELEILHEIGRELLGSTDLKSLLDRILRRIAFFASVDLGVIRPFDATDKVLLPLVSFGYRDPDRIIAHSIEPAVPGHGRINNAAFNEQSTHVVEDVLAAPGLRTLKAERARSAIFVPIVVEDKVIGTILLASRTPRKFPPELLRTLEAIGNQIGVAMQKARLFDETQSSLTRIRALYEVNKAVDSSLDLGTILSVLLEQIEIFVPVASASSVTLLNPQTGALEPTACRGLGEEEWRAARQSRVGKSSRRVVETKLPVAVRNLLADPQTYNPAVFESRGLVSYLGVPLIAKDEVLGALDLYVNQEHDFKPEEVEFLTTLAGQAAMAIHNARLFELAKTKELEVRKAARNLDALYTVATVANQSLDIHTMLQAAVAKIKEIFDFDATRIYLYTPQHDELRLTAWSENVLGSRVRVDSFPRGCGNVGRVAETGEPLIFEDLQVDPEYRKTSLSDGSRRAGFKFLAGFPIKGKRGVLGTLLCVGIESRRFTTAEVQLLESMTNHIAIALENAALHQTTIDRANELQAQSSELEAANKVKDQFLNVMSHELRTPVNIIMGYTGMVREKMLGEINSQQEDALLKAQSHAKDLVQMVERILQVTQIETSKTQAHQFTSSVSGFLHTLRTAYEIPTKKNVAMEWEIPADLPEVNLDFEKLKHVLQNLINNAIKFTEHGQVKITGRYLIEKRALEIKVADTGVGIPREAAPFIFDLFHQADSSATRPYDGMGLGLYIVKKYCELLSANIDLESAPGIGSTFTVSIPCEPQAHH